MHPENEEEEPRKKKKAPPVGSSAAPHGSNPESDDSVPGDDGPHQAQLSERIKGLHDKHAQLRRLFEGTGKKNGKPLAGPAEYDRAYVTALVKYGVVDVDEAAAAVLARPDGHALRNGGSYARGIADEALAAVRAVAAEQRAGEAERFAEARSYTDFEVEKVHVVASDASRYELHIDGKVLALSAKQLSNQNEFRQAFLNVLHRMPALPPTKKKKARPWDDLVNSWLRDAVKEALVGNATDEEVLRRAVAKAKNAIPASNEPAKLHLDMALEVDGRRYFTADAVYDRVKQFDRNFKHRDLARILRELGCEFDENFSAGDRPIEVWSERLAAPPGMSPCTGTPGAGQPASASASGAAQPNDGPQVEVTP